MGKRKAAKNSSDSDSDYVPTKSSEKKTATAIVPVVEKKEWSKEDIEALVKEGIAKYKEEAEDVEEESVVVGLKTYLALHRCDLDWFDSNQGDRDDLISKWVDANIMEAKYELKKTSFLCSMNQTKLKSFKAFKRNLR